MRRDFSKERSSGPKTRINEDIRVPEVRVIDAEGNQIGIIPIEEAQQRAEAVNLDLVEVAPDAKPPVCRIMNFGKYLYQLSKKAQEAKKKQKRIQVKEINFRPNTDEHDFQFKKNHIVRFLSNGDKVKVTIRFRGRELAHKNLGVRIVKRLEEELAELGTLETHPKMEGIRMHAIFGPKKT